MVGDGSELGIKKKVKKKEVKSSQGICGEKKVREKEGKGRQGNREKGRCTTLVHALESSGTNGS